jgi:hypothetical protein
MKTGRTVALTLVEMDDLPAFAARLFGAAVE